MSDRDIARIHALNGGIAIQDRMRYQGDYFVDRYGAGTAAASPPIQSMLRHKVHVGCGTDGTRVSSYNPWESVAWLVNGRTVSGLSLYPVADCLSRMEALRLWTVANAWFTHEEATKGSLEVGKLADLVVLNQDYFTVDDAKIETIESLLTMVGGKIVYVHYEWAAEVGITAEPVRAVSPSWSPVNLFGGYQLCDSTAWPNQTAGDSKDWQSSDIHDTTKLEAMENDRPAGVRSIDAFFVHGHTHGHAC